MRRAPASTLIAYALVCLLAGAVLGPSTVPGGGAVAARSTIEPTLPLTLDLLLTAVDETERGASASLEVTVDAGAEIRDLSLALRLPEGVRGDAEFPGRGASTALERGERRRYVVPLSAPRRGVLPIRVEASFRLPDGRSFRTEQGATLRLGVPGPECRWNAGAYECMGVPPGEMSR